MGAGGEIKWSATFAVEVDFVSFVSLTYATLQSSSSIGLKKCDFKFLPALNLKKSNYQLQ